MSAQNWIAGGAFPFATMFLIFVSSVLLTSKYVFQLVFGKQSRLVWVDWICAVLATTLVCVLAFDATQQWQSLLNGVLGFWLSVSTIGLAVLASLLHLRFAKLTVCRRELLRAPSVWALLIVSIGMTWWAAHRFYSSAIPIPSAPYDQIPPGLMGRVEDLVGVTDRGHAFPLYELEVDSEDFGRFSQTAAKRQSKYSQAAILRNNPDPHSNCHGWVFTGGRYLLTGDTVERILKDNGYTVLESPCEGDLIIYRNSQNQIVHTGLVRGVLNDGTVMVESKWGVDSRFLHRPDDQPYGPNYDFYRSLRPNHLVTITRSTDHKQFAESPKPETALTSNGQARVTDSDRPHSM